MAMLDKYGAQIRVFMWNVNLPAKSPSQPSYTYMFLVRLTTLIPSNDKEGFHRFRYALTSYLEIKPDNFEVFPATRRILYETLELHRILAACPKDLALIVNQITTDICCKFRFSPETLSGQGPKPVIYLELVVRMRRDALESDDIKQIVTSFNNNSHDQPDKLIFGLDSTCEEIEDVLKRKLGTNVRESKGLIEVKAGLEINFLDGGDSEEKICPICMQRLSQGEAVVKTSCSHVFHKVCIFNWLLRSDSCPCCRSSCAVCV